jgi:hypothetical protein
MGAYLSSVGQSLNPTTLRGAIGLAALAIPGPRNDRLNLPVAAPQRELPVNLVSDKELLSPRGFANPDYRAEAIRRNQVAREALLNRFSVRSEQVPDVVLGTLRSVNTQPVDLHGINMGVESSNALFNQFQRITDSVIAGNLGRMYAGESPEAGWGGITPAGFRVPRADLPPGLNSGQFLGALRKGGVDIGHTADLQQIARENPELMRQIIVEYLMGKGMRPEPPETAGR